MKVRCVARFGVYRDHKQPELKRPTSIVGQISFGGAVQYSLAEQPWIPVLTDTGMGQRGLLTVFDSDVRTIATGDPLADVAILRLLLAIRIAANTRAVTPQQWVSGHADRFDLFSPTQPFGQNPDMARFVALPGATRPIIAASYALAGSGSTAANPFHTLSGVTFTPAAAARLLLMRQAFSVGGIQQFTEAVIYEDLPDTRPGKEGAIRRRAAGSAAYGKAPLSAKTAVCTNRAFVWIDTGDLTTALDHNAALVADRPAGTFHFGWPDPGTPPPITGTPTGVLDALTWPSRSIYLVPADPVTDIMICDGLRWPEATTPGWTPETEAELIPHAVFERKTKTAPFTIQGVHAERVPWRQLLTGLAADQPAGTVLASALSAAVQLEGSTVRICGLGSYQARIDGPVAGAFPVPAPGVDVTGLAELVAGAFTSHGSYCGALAHAAGLTDRAQSAALVSRLSRYSALPTQLEPVAAAAARGRLSLSDARAAVAEIVDAANRSALNQFRRVHPEAAGRVAARKAAQPLAENTIGRKDI